MNEYKKLLEKAMKDKPKECIQRDRCEIPKVTGRIQGNTTIITNFGQISKFFNRDPNQILKFLLRELATPGKLDNSWLIFNRKLNPKLINEKLEKYASIYVFCYECKKPDTKIVTENNKLYLKCMACGAKNHVRQ